MDTHNQDDKRIYNVVVNHEEQYSLWSADQENAPGWKAEGMKGTKEECLAYIKKVWTDMRPLSLRKQMLEAEKNGNQSSQTPSEVNGDNAPKLEPLVDRLCRGNHPVELCMLPQKSARTLKDWLDRRYVHIKFPNTVGGTELGVEIDLNASDLSQADFNNELGQVHLVGGLTLDYVQIRCIADINLTTLSGEGRLERVDASVN